MEKSLYLYEALVYPSVGGYEVYVPDLDAYTQGDDLHEAAYMGQDLVQGILSYLIEEGRDVPSATFGHETPEGGYVMILATEAPVPEVPEMSVQDAADVLGVSRARVYAMCSDGTLDSRKVGVSVMVSAESVRRRSAEPHGAGRPRRDLATA